MRRFNGILALDLDGTIAHPCLDQQVVDRLNCWIKEGWHVAFITGRMYPFAHSILQFIQGPYSLAVQNGAEIYKLSCDQLYRKRHLHHEAISILEHCFRKEGMGWCLESGSVGGDICYYCPSDFLLEERIYVEQRMQHSHAVLMPVDSWLEIPLQSFACAKCFGSCKQMQSLASSIPYRLIAIQDPLRPGQCLAHITHPHATKGAVLLDLQEEEKIPVIAAGDDHNDASLLAAADVAIAMDHAPPEILALADLRASAHHCDIITCIQKAMQLLI